MSLQTYTQQCYLILLKQSWTKCKERNPRYSLRSFSRQLGISPASLCLILSGKRRVGTAAARKIETLLMSKESVAEHLAVEAAKREKPVVPRDLLLDTDTHWYHLAIVNLLNDYGALISPEWIALHLAIPEDVAVKALDYLESKGYKIWNR